MLHNWRKIEGAKDVYPRFEVMAERFRAQLEQLQNFVASLSPQTLNINQAEVSYINHILLESLYHILNKFFRMHVNNIQRGFFL
jgi:sigma54-dependent transcription regulator